MSASWRLLFVAGLGAVGCSQGGGGEPSPGDAGPAADATRDAPSTEDVAPVDAVAIPVDTGTDAGDAAPAPTCINPTTRQSCSPPVMTALPLCKLSQTGCMDPASPTHFAAGAVYYEVNSPLWSDDAAKARAFVLPDGGTIHVKDCMRAERTKPVTIVIANAPMNPSHVFFGERRIRGVRPKKNPKT